MRIVTWTPPAYTEEDVPPPYRETIEEESLAVSHVYLLSTIRIDSKPPSRSSTIFDGTLHGVRKHAKKSKPPKKTTASSGSKREAPAEGPGKSSLPTKDGKNLGGASKGGDEEDDKKKKKEEARKKKEEEEIAKKKQEEEEEAARIKEEEEEAARIKEEEEEAARIKEEAAAAIAAAEEKRVEEERRAADEIANADPWGDELDEENTRSGWGFSLTGTKKKPAKTTVSPSELSGWTRADLVS